VEAVPCFTVTVEPEMLTPVEDEELELLSFGADFGSTEVLFLGFAAGVAAAGAGVVAGVSVFGVEPESLVGAAAGSFTAGAVSLGAAGSAGAVVGSLGVDSEVAGSFVGSEVAGSLAGSLAGLPPVVLLFFKVTLPEMLEDELLS
jgi:hypothetical protein